jgi:hypothetical protein
MRPRGARHRPEIVEGDLPDLSATGDTGGVDRYEVWGNVVGPNREDPVVVLQLS